MNIASTRATYRVSRRMVLLVLIVAAQLVFVLGRSVRAQAGADPVLDRIDALERVALQESSRGRYDRAFEPIAVAITELLAAYDRAESVERRERLAVASETLLLYFDSIVHRLDAFAKARTAVDRWLESDLDPLVRARLLHHRGRYNAAVTGNDDPWAADRLGFLTDWQLLGPFDNEQGSGFDTPYAPETAIDLGAVVEARSRELEWRRIPETDSGFVPFARLFYPSEQVFAYAATTLEVPEDTDAAFRLGSDEAIRVFLDGHVVFERDVRRSCRFDQDAFGVRLSAGRHTLVVKLAQRVDDWGFALRLTDPSGEPLPAITHDASQASFESVLPKPEAPPESIRVREGAGGYFRELDSTVADALTLRHAAWFHLILGPDDPGDRTAYGFARRLTERLPEDPHAWFVLANAISLPIKMRPELEENERREALSRVLRLDPDHAEASLEMAVHYLRSIEMPDRALAYCDEALRVNDTFVSAALARADALRAKGLFGAAEAEVRRLGESSASERIEVLMALAERDARRGRLSKAVERAEAALSKDRRNARIRDRLADWYEESGRIDEALALVDEALEQRPLSLWLYGTRARLLRAQGNLEAANRSLEEALAISPQNPAFWKNHGVMLRRLGRDEAALLALESARELDPKDRWLEGYLEFLQQETRPFEDDFPFDAAALRAEAEEWETPSDTPYRYVLRRSLVKIYADGTSSRYFQDWIDIENRNGADALARYPIPFHPETQRVKLRSAKVTRADGTQEDGELARGRSAGVAWVSLPVLEPGDRIELAYRVDDVRTGIFGDYFGMRSFLQRGDGAPILHSELTVITPVGRAFDFDTKNGVPEARVRRDDANGLEIRTWELREIPRFEPEPYMPPREEVVPLVEVTTYGSWNEFSRWWWNLIEKQFLTSPAMEDWIEELRARTDSTAERVREVYDYVTTQIRYVAWEFGIHGYQPYRASTIFARRFGDCKDKSILMRTMLERLGIESHPVLIRAEQLRGEQDLSTALLNHFNHCILFVPGVELEGPSGAQAEDGIYLDGTAQYNDWRSLPSTDQGARVLIVEGEDSRVATTPVAPADANLISIEERVNVRAGGTARVEGTLRAMGDSAAQLRAVLANEGARDEHVAARFTSLFGPVEIVSTDYSNLADLNAPVWYSYVIEIPNALKRSGGNASLPSLFSAPTLSDFTERPTRRFDLLLPSLTSWESEVTFEFEEPLRGRVRFDDVMLENPHGSFTRITETQGSEITVRARFETKSRRIPAAQYEPFRTFSRRIDQSVREVIRVR